MDGGLGNDTMTGGLGADTFQFLSGCRSDHRLSTHHSPPEVGGPEVDRLEIAASLLSKTVPVREELRDHASLDGAGNLLLDFGDSNTLTLIGVETVDAILNDVSFT